VLFSPVVLLTLIRENGLKQLFQVPGWNAEPLVGDGDGYLPVVTPDRDIDPGAGL